MAATTIDHLPAPLLLRILSFLPTINAVRASLVSRRWRELWRHVRRLNFDMSLYHSPPNALCDSRDFFADFVTQTLLLREHSTRLYSFHLLFNYRRTTTQVNSWIRYAIASGVVVLLLVSLSDRANLSLTLHCLYKGFRTQSLFCNSLVRSVQYNLEVFLVQIPTVVSEQGVSLALGILSALTVFKAIDGKYADNVSDDKKLENDEYAYSSIILNLSDSVIRKVGKQVSAKMLWDKLEELYTETSLPSKLFLLEKFFRYKLDMSKNIDENIDEFTKLIQDIKLTGDKNIDDYSPIVLLNAIPETYGDVKAAIKYGRDNVQLETVVSGLKSKEIDLKISKSSQNTSEVNFVRDKKEWIIDSGCTFHMTPFREILSNYKTEKLGCVSMANEKLCAVHGLGDVCMIFENGFKLTLKNVRHVPDLAQNLISCSALEEEGLEREMGSLVLCDEFGIKRHKTTPYTPQQNGVAERTLLNKVRCLLISSGLSKTFWGEALSTAVYLINRSPSVPLLGKIPECMWTGKDVDISSLRIFGCSAFVLQNGDKLDPRAKKCIFIGYPVGVKGYRLWLRNQPGYKVIVSRDVTFNESEFPCLANSSKKDLDHNIESTFNKVEDNPEETNKGKK
ncbi:Retrovirus-related Pol polyprotein from transposon TNT 1-94 [Sesamum angolense]|uniref:Retrovirus-related Pol polyprotein from transposon TNT 1-94 n=1 Tax=Sesamum angolense TaxID=2727404 RepID=A0AAE1WQT0_9LAMI|nr:Retrovirus-related Pol polyprotein from transposon TNT 1-94 [Sesamum angolense]